LARNSPTTFCPSSWSGRASGDRLVDSNVVVEQASIGPYDYAVLKADDESAMLQWLSDNRYFVPAYIANEDYEKNGPATTAERATPPRMPT